MPTLSADELRTLVVRIFQAAGVDERIAEHVAHDLVESNLAGVDSHGVIRIPDYVGWLKAGKIACDDQMEIVQDRGATALLDGHRTFGPVVAGRAVEIAVQKAKDFGLGMISARNASHIGRLGAYVERVARQGLIGFMCCNAQGAVQFVAPWGGRESRLSTNPVAWGIPTGGDPMVIDISTAAAAEGRIRVGLRRGETLPEGWIIDAQGDPTTNPADFYGPPMGAILPASGHKGYGLAMIVEALSGALSGGGCVRPVDETHAPLNAFTLLAADVSMFRALTDFTGAVDSYVAYVKTSPPQKPGGEVLVPYEPELRTRQRRLAQGIEIEPGTWQRLVETARDLGLEI